MEHLTLKAATTATDQGTFEAVISTASVDRDGDIVEPAAMVAALAKWAALGKLMPLAWDHTKNVIGHIDPSSAHVEGNEVVAKGFIDQAATGINGETLGEQAWRLVKSGTLSFSYGMLVPKTGAKKRAGGGLHITELDLFEVSVIPVAPANNDTRILSFKSLQDEILAIQERLILLGEENRDSTLSVLEAVKTALGVEPEQKTTDETDKEPEKARSVPPVESALKMALDVLTEGAEPPKVVTKEKPKQVPELDPDELRKRSRDLMVQVLTGI